jgi:hypothetical protein
VIAVVVLSPLAQDDLVKRYPDTLERLAAL